MAGATDLASAAEAGAGADSAAAPGRVLSVMIRVQATTFGCAGIENCPVYFRDVTILS
jgi:hypothetical protein